MRRDPQHRRILLGRIGAEHVDSISNGSSAPTTVTSAHPALLSEQTSKSNGQTLGTEVINHQYTLDMALYRLLNPRCL